MTCRDEVLAAFASLSNRTGRDDFSPAEIIDEMKRAGTTYADSTIRTDVVSRMCVDAPDHHAVVYPDLLRIGDGRYRLRNSDHEEGAQASRVFSDAGEIEAVPPHPLLSEQESAPDPVTLPGTRVTEDELAKDGFDPLTLQVIRVDVALFSGVGALWDIVGEVPESPGIYAFTVEDGHSMHVTYVGLTKHLWMVTKGRLPDGQARGGQRYGRPKHAGATRERINVLAATQLRRGNTVKHWIKPFQIGEGEDPYPELRAAEETLIVRWNLRTTGWNRG